ncbi:SDR family oxidoreductase [Chitinophaga polysaccharea]|uniref:SDR family oxidoreductase n=1 Tax=Chitinophaga polysaccharea TaxID=1293035 RepID=UPI00115BF9FD|nr:SDR family oxidoreductase [Chitinophaga polysaccharea]
MDRTIFITGTSSGLGKATAKLFSEKGWTVVATMRNIEETELAQLPNVHLLELDVNNPEQVIEVTRKAEEISPIDVLFNNAGYVLAGALEAITDEQLDHQLNTNLQGTIRVTRALLPYFRNRKEGLIITTTSLGAYIPEPFMAVYSATKSALEAWTEGMYYELDRIGIRIKTIVPSFMNTNFVGNAKIALHPAYQESLDKVISTFSNSEAGTNADNPEDIALIVYEAVTDGKKQLHYFAGDDANTRYQSLKKDGIDVVIDARSKSIFEQ